MTKEYSPSIQFLGGLEGLGDWWLAMATSSKN